MTTQRGAVVRRCGLAGLLCCLAWACTRSDSNAPPPDRDLVVFAAASLREAFVDLGAKFERAHPGVAVRFNFAGSQELRLQIEHGARPDIFASADQRHIDALGTDTLAPSVIFARNELALVVATEAASTIASLEDVPTVERVVLAAPEVPAGRYTLELLDRASQVFGADFRARVESRVVSRELNVRQALAKVILGEAQAGLVYRTDAQAAGDRVVTRAIPSSINVVTAYPVVTLNGAAQPQLARAWIDFVLSPQGQGRLAVAGFLPVAEAGAP